jgi:GT2 family glycosyltransferase
MRTAVAILNWNGQNFLESFLPEIVEHTASSAEIWVIDNASIDGSVLWLQKNYPQVNIVVNQSNGGYAKGYNDGLKKIDADIFVLLNSDVEVTKGWLEPLIEMMKNPDYAAIQPKVLSFQNRNQFEYAGAAGGFIDRDGFMFCRGRMFNTFEQDNGQYDDCIEVFWATGACLVVRSSAFWQVDGLDEDFFAHMEEIDLCWRLKNAGHKIGYCGKSTVYHVGGGTLSRISPRKTYLNFRNNLFLLLKNYRGSSIFFKLFFRMFLDGVAAFKFLFEGHLLHFFAVFRAHMSFYWSINKFSEKRKRLAATIHNPNSIGFYEKSVVWAYFVKKKRDFSQLEKAAFKKKST